MNKTSFEDYLENHNTLVYKNVGTSMLPMIKEGRDIFVVGKKGEKRCEKYDVILYRRPPNYYVLHRVIKVTPNGYVVLGDNCIAKEYGITDEDIIGIMTEFVHKGKTYKANSKLYLAYVHIWCKTAWLRIPIKKFKGKLARCVKKIIK